MEREFFAEHFWARLICSMATLSARMEGARGWVAIFGQSPINSSEFRFRGV